MTTALIDMLLAKIGLVRAKHANRWAYQASVYRCCLHGLHRDTPHDTVKQEIENVLYQADSE